MKALTQRQRQILEFIQAWQEREGTAPSFREIAAHFGFASLATVADHLRLLRRKGVLAAVAGRKRVLRVISPWESLRRPLVHIPLYGSIPAGFAREREQEAHGCVSIDIATLGLKPGPRTFALKVQGDSMVGRHIVEGDVVILEHGKTPRPGDVVAALIDNESTLKTLVLEQGRPCLRAENPRYPRMIPASELMIQGVMVGLIRKV